MDEKDILKAGFIVAIEKTFPNWTWNIDVEMKVKDVNIKAEGFSKY